MKIKRSFRPCERYFFDIRACKVSDGWAQVDTIQDASYFGNWANPFTLEMVSYAEGDIRETQCESLEEFITEMEDMLRYYNQDGWMKIDPGLIEKNKQRWITIGLGHLLH